MRKLMICRRSFQNAFPNPSDISSFTVKVTFAHTFVGVHGTGITAMRRRCERFRLIIILDLHEILRIVLGVSKVTKIMIQPSVVLHPTRR